MEKRARVGVVLGVLIAGVIGGCAVLQEPQVKRFHDMNGYKYAIIPQTASHTSGSGGISYDMGFGMVASGAVAKSVNPGEVIAGILMKKGYIVVDKSDRDGAFLVKYGQGDRRNVLGGLGGYTLGVSIQMLDSKTHEPLFICTAEGQGETEADDIRKAIARCLRDL